ncbi:hypothetical protein NM208_g9153 [Fusarium decemcellulare]|uniref:Uncharacterized protein n=1 Tax=Fusarium decemcellulare TaxID=57161 RepID=A0ACC1S383_9HYPO|nr:hypothetical protein NM208_g9153 [Fusarium decemcellulare]
MIGTGALTRAGPLSIFLGYSITGVGIWMLMQVLAEMAVWISLPGAIPQFYTRVVDPALGFAVGWKTDSVNVAVWISIFIVLVVGLNIFGVGIYGEAEFIFAWIKIITMVGLLILGFNLDLGGGPSGERLGFRYWNNPGATKDPRQCSLSYAIVEIVAVASGESQNPKRNLPKATRRIFWRILFFYSLGSLAIGVLVIAIKHASIPVLLSIINAVILSSALSSCNAFLYTGSRYLLALASSGHAPKFFLKTTNSGNPIYCVATTAIFSLLTYLSVSSGPYQIFLWFQSFTTMCTLLTWSSIRVAYLHFYGGLKANNIDRRLWYIELCFSHTGQSSC